MKHQMKDTIADAFILLAKQKSIDKITVKDLVDHCGISRQSFYYHFQDILDVIEWHTLRVGREITQQVQQAATLDEAIDILSAAYIAHHALLEKLRDSQKRNFVERLVMESMQERFGELVRNSSASSDLTVAETDALIRFFSFGLAGLMASSCYNREISVGELSAQIRMVFRRLTPDHPEF